MKIGILSDIHGNDVAFEAVLHSAKKANIEKLFVLGDVVGYYYHPEKVLDLLSKWNFEFIKGNHEDILEKILNKSVDISEIKKKYGSGHEKAIQKLSTASIDFLLNAKSNHHTEIESVTMSFFHCNSFDDHTYVYPDTAIEILDKCYNGSDFIFIGHSHYQFVHPFQKGGTLINVGSVGQSREKGGVATWCVLNTSNRVFQMMGTSYNAESLIREVREIDPETEYLQQVLIRSK